MRWPTRVSVTFIVTDTRVGQRTDYDKLVLEVETDGSLAPTEAVCRAANIINQYMGAFLALASTGEEEEGEAPSIFAPEGQESNAELDKQIEDLDLSVRSYNCLKRAGIHSVRLLRSADTYPRPTPMRMVMSSWPPSATVAMT